MDSPASSPLLSFYDGSPVSELSNSGVDLNPTADDSACADEVFTGCELSAVGCTCNTGLWLCENATRCPTQRGRLRCLHALVLLYGAVAGRASFVVLARASAPTSMFTCAGAVVWSCCWACVIRCTCPCFSAEVDVYMRWCCCMELLLDVRHSLYLPVLQRPSLPVSAWA